MKHTRGPWTRHMIVPGGECLIAGTGDNGRVEVCTVHKEAEYGQLPINENSALIMAAPQLLEACKLVLAFMEKHHSLDGQTAIHALKFGIHMAENGK